MNYLNSPIIVKGVNHSGTRAVVEILKLLGSDEGDISNKWKENKFFLNIHKTLVNRISKNGWQKTIFDSDFIENGYVDNFEYLDFLKLQMLDLNCHYTDPQNIVWHWKCPSSVFFDKSWHKIFPDAYSIIIQRDPHNVARSLIRDNIFENYDEAIYFHKVMNEKIISSACKNVLIINYANLKEDINKIIDFIPLNIPNEKIKIAKSFIYEENIFKKSKSLKYNIKNILTECDISLQKLKQFYKNNLTSKY